MKFRYRITATGLVQVCADSDVPGNESWVTVTVLTDRQQRDLATVEKNIQKSRQGTLQL